MNIYEAMEAKSATVGTGAVATMASFAFTAAYLAKAVKATITAGANVLRVSWSPTSPTSTLGAYVAAYGSLEVEGQVNVAAIKAIAVGGDSVVTICIEKQAGA